MLLRTTDISSLKLYATHEHPCSYLQGQLATTVFIDPSAEINLALYGELSELGFRRSGSHIYRPPCRSCQACIPLRLPVAGIKLSRSQKRCLKRNADIDTRFVASIDTDEHYLLYERYLEQRHANGDMYPATRHQFREFLSAEWGSTRYLEFRLGNRLLALAVTDFLENGVSAIYTFYDPDEAGRSLGTYAILKQLDIAQQADLPYVYLGYWIKECAKMKYKTHFRPVQMFVQNRWITFT